MMPTLPIKTKRAYRRRRLLPQLMSVLLLFSSFLLNVRGPVEAAASAHASAIIHKNHIPAKLIAPAPVIAKIKPAPIAKSTTLARVTYYYPGEDSYTNKLQTSTGVTAHVGICAVDPKKIPFYKKVYLSGIGVFRALDSGSAVVSRKAAKESAHNKAERNALVVDVYCSSAHQARIMELNNPAYVAVYWE